MKSGQDPSSDAVLPQAGAIPFRWEGRIRMFCLITDSSDTYWVFPKGMIDPGHTPHTTALNEAWEEAGVRGRLLTDPLGMYEYRKGSMRASVLMYLLEIDEVLMKWPESRWRRRRFCTAAEARKVLGRPEQRPLLEEALRRLGE